MDEGITSSSVVLLFNSELDEISVPTPPTRVGTDGAVTCKVSEVAPWVELNVSDVAELPTADVAAANEKAEPEPDGVDSPDFDGRDSVSASKTKTKIFLSLKSIFYHEYLSLIIYYFTT